MGEVAAVDRTLALLDLNFISLVDRAASSVPFSFMREIFQLSITLGEWGRGREMRTSNFPSPSLWLCLSGWLNLGRLKKLLLLRESPVVYFENHATESKKITRA